MPTSIDELDIHSERILTLGSGCKIEFVKKDNRIIPILVLTGINREGVEGERVITESAHGRVGIITSRVDDITHHNIVTFKSEPITIQYYNEQYPTRQTDWLQLNYNTDKIVYPRIFIKSLKVRTDSDSLVMKYQDYNDVASDSNNKNQVVNYITLKPYEDYSVLTRSLDEQYVITLNPEMVATKGATGSYSGNIEARQAMIKYSISNADTSIYLDAVEIAKENSVPKVSYEVKPNVLNSKYCECLYNQMGNIVRINDEDLKFHNVQGYISGITLDLDNLDEDVIEVKNYKTKFEDLFSTITAQTEQMKKNNRLLEVASSAFTASGELSEDVLQTSIMKVDLDYAFNNGHLTIDEHNGIWGTSDTGVVAFRGGGIFTSTEKNAEGNWKWNTGITPEGINANLITSGQLDTNLIRIYSGDNLRFQMNGDGIFAYKSIIVDKKNNGEHPSGADVQPSESIDGKQYVLFNDEGLSLIMKKGAKILNKAKTDYITVLDDEEVNKNSKLLGVQEIKRVEVSWDGFILRNLQNERVFWADPEDGNLNIKGRIDAIGGSIGAWNIDNHKLWADSAVQDGVYTTFVAINAGSETALYHRDGSPYTDPINGQKLLVDTAPYAFWAGAAKPDDAPFYIRKDGILKAASGQVGGWSMEGGLFYNPASLVLAPTVAKNSQGSITVKVPILDDDDKITGYTTKTIPFNNLVLWVPSETWRNKYNNRTATVWQSNSDASLTITQDGALTADKINGCGRLWFTGGTIYSVTGSTYVTIRWYNPDGSTSKHSFNTASGVKAHITSIKYSGNGQITVTACALYPSGGTISGSQVTDSTKLNFDSAVRGSNYSGSVVFYINGTAAYTRYFKCDKDSGSIS